jgi:hypothetical protein
MRQKDLASTGMVVVRFSYNSIRNETTRCVRQPQALLSSDQLLANFMVADPVVEDELKALAPEHPDSKACIFGSPQQIRKAAKLLGVGLPDTKGGTLALYAKEHKFINTVRNYRKASKLAGTYGAGWLENGYY